MTGERGAAPELEGGRGLGQCGAQAGGFAGRMELKLLGGDAAFSQMGEERNSSREKRVWKDLATGSFRGRMGESFADHRRSDG